LNKPKEQSKIDNQSRETDNTEHTHTHTKKTTHTQQISP